MSEQFNRDWKQDGTFGNGKRASYGKQCPPGRWPANLIHDGSEEVVELFPATGPAKASNRGAGKGETGCFGVYGGEPGVRGHDDNGGSAARFFYCAKASKADRDEGCEGLEAREGASTSNGGKAGKVMTVGAASLRGEPIAPPKSRNHHPTVKPADLMRYLCRLVTPPGGVVLDPFMGSGSTGKAAILEGFRFIGCEREAEYLDIARARIEAVVNERAQELPLAAS
jgi:site-specific DNA-methyltransferase (adenine-specific)